MNILFLSIVHKENIESPGIYTDLLRQFRDNGHNVYIMSPYERRTGKSTEYLEENGVHMLSVKIGNITKCGLIEKGISTIMIEQKYLKAIKKYFKNIKFDLILYPTPPITLVGVVEQIKKRDHAKTYLLLKDIFPQNAVDLGMLSTTGIKGYIYKYFRKKEKRLYAVSDFIGCMSKANVDYVFKHNPEIKEKCIEVCPNSIEVRESIGNTKKSNLIREKFGIPIEKKVFVYGGNLGKPQSIPFIIECLRETRKNTLVHFVIVGDGTEYIKLEQYVKEEKPKHVTLIKRLPKDEFEKLVESCDVGLIFLDNRFTIPNFPSRLLSYMRMKIPVFACTDSNTDVGKVITVGNFGWWCPSGDVMQFVNIIDIIVNENCQLLGKNGYQYLKEHYTVENAYKIIMKHF